MNLDNTFKFKRRILIMNNNRNQCPAGSNPYTIRAGDTFFMLAKSHNVSVDELLKANPGVDPDRLFIGQNICIPSSTSTPPSSSKCPTLRMGSQGSDVRRLQRLLREEGFNPGSIDGIFGPQTQRAVIAFQRSENLTPDGIVGVNTWTALGEDCSTRPPGDRCPSGTFAYTIRSGDNPYRLANQYNTTVEAILKANPGMDPNRLQIGQVICIPSSSDDNDCSNNPTLRKGSRGSYVVELQERLKDAGFNPGAVDGIFGDQTERAVINFQRSANLTRDGIVGPKTWNALCKGDITPPKDDCPSGTFPYRV